MSERMRIRDQGDSGSLPAPAGAGLLRRRCACGGTPGPSGECDECRRQRLTLQRQATPQVGPTSVPPVVRDVLRSPGRPLDTTTRSFMEPRFGHDFGRVRVHADTKAAESARAVNALAYVVGQHAVFGAGQYAPGTGSGQRLLAHELAHVVQQGGHEETAGPQENLRVSDAKGKAERDADTLADRVLTAGGGQAWETHAALRQVPSGTLQRTPAPPTRGGVTGDRDPSRIRIDAVPDFLASSFTAPLDINVYVADATVTHLTWLLYDPSDNILPRFGADPTGSFATLPGLPDSTTRPFRLEPAHFSGANFVEGKYLLRCIGRAAGDRPVVYADRDFNVLASDLTTGTALPTTYGDLTFTRYEKTDADPPATPKYYVNVELRFLPNTTVRCRDVAFIQSIRTTDNQGKSQARYMYGKPDARQTPLAWFIDAGKHSPFYVEDTNKAGKAVDDPEFGLVGRGGRSPFPAALYDRPNWDRENVFQAEACAVCRSGRNTGQVYGCATWGYTADAAGKVTLMPRGFRQMPSEQFEEARAAWNAWSKTKPANARPEEAPELESP